MFIKSNHIMFILWMITGSIVAISSNTWFTAWLGLEINLMMITPMIIIKIKTSLTESAIKYFIAQAMASLFMISSINFNSLTASSWSMESSETIILITLMIKAGMPPFHLWFPQIMKPLPWLQCILMMTWQKLAPMMLLSYIPINKTLLTAALAVFVGSISGLNQTDSKLIMTFSSISHSGWVIMAACLNFNLWMIYFSLYSFMSMSVVYYIYLMNIQNINEIQLSQTNNISKYAFCINMLSLAGLPPFLGFTIKMSVIWQMMIMSLIILPALMIFCSLLTIYFYCRILYSPLTSMTTKKMVSFSHSKITTPMMLMSTFFNIFVPLISLIN